MKLEEAKAECERWFSHLKWQEEKSIALQRLASERRAGTCDEAEVRRRLSQIQGRAPTVYDGGNLARSVKVLLKHIPKNQGDRTELPHDGGLLETNLHGDPQ